ncbi:MAG: NADH-quinone oxidoreductase subunit J [Microthrixaceae bacterium]
MIASLLAAGADPVCRVNECSAVPANIAFGIGAVFMVFAAVKVVTSRNVVHAALYLVIVLSGVALDFILLQSEFVAVTQVLVYIGAIVVLLLFGVMLTRAPLGVSDDLDNVKARPVGVLVGVVLLTVLAGSLISSFGDDKVALAAPNTVRSVSDAIFGPYLVPFEVVSVLLLAALVGAIVLARKE